MPHISRSISSSEALYCGQSDGGTAGSRTESESGRCSPG
ncbi:hypothetical protein A2U01_0082851, partial [Trifolium medium]|nr:hypothetical protein [Trifolium medium]